MVSLVRERRASHTIVNDYGAGVRTGLALLIAVRLRRLAAFEAIVLDTVDLRGMLVGLVLGDVDGEAGGEVGVH